MRSGEPDPFTRSTRSGPHVVALQSLMIWLASWVYLKRVAEQVLCGTELDRYHRHLQFLRELVTDYPCSEAGQRSGGCFSGLTYFAARPHVALRWHALTAWSCAEELGDSCVFLINAIFCMAAVFFPNSQTYQLLRRVFLVVPYFLHHLLSVPLRQRGGVPSLLARQVPFRPAFMLYFALMGAHCWLVIAAAAVTLASTVATTVLLLRAGVPISYQPLRVVVHILLASIAAVAWAALWEGWLPGPRLLHSLGLGRRATSAVTAGRYMDHTAPQGRSRATLAAEGRTAATATEAVDAGAEWPDGLSTPAPVPGPGSKVVVKLGGDKGRHDVVVNANVWSCRAAAAVDKAKVESGGVEKPRRRRVAMLFPSRLAGGWQPWCKPAKCDRSSAPPAGSCKAVTSPCDNAHRFRDGRRSSQAGLHATHTGQRLPLWPLSLLRKMGGGGLAAASSAPIRHEELTRGTGGELPLQHQHLQQWSWQRRLAVLPPAGAGGEARRRFMSQVRRSVLRIRIVGADPEQLPANWQEVVFAHFNSRCGALDGPSAASYLASGVAVRRGSIFLTVSLVQLPSPYDGGEGPGGAARGPAAQERNEGAAVAAARAEMAACDSGEQALVAERMTAAAATAASATSAASCCSVQGPGGSQAAIPAHTHACRPTNHGAAGVTTNTCNSACPSTSCRHRQLSPGVQPSPQLQPSASPGTIDGNSSGLHNAPAVVLAPLQPLGYTSGRRRIASVWCVERHGATNSTSSPASTPGNSNNLLHVLGPAAVASIWPSSPLPTVFTGPTLATAHLTTAPVSFSVTPSPSFGPGMGPGGALLQQVQRQQPMRYTPLLSPTQQMSLCAGPGLTQLLPPPRQPQLHGQQQPSGGGSGAEAAVASSTGAATPLTHGSLYAAGGIATASMQVAQLLDTMQLHSLDNMASTTNREARAAGFALGSLSAVSQLDGGAPLHLRQVLAMQRFEGPGSGGEAPSSSWEVDSAYERPMPPSRQRQAASPLQQQQSQHQQTHQQPLRTAENGLDRRSGMTAPPPPYSRPAVHMQVAPAAVAPVTSGLPRHDGGLAADMLQPLTGAPVAVQPTQRGYRPATMSSHNAPGPQPGGAAAWASASSAAMWPPNTAGLAVLADPASLPVHGVAVKPILICKAPLVCAAAAGDLAASIPAVATSAITGDAVAAAAATTTSYMDNRPGGLDVSRPTAVSPGAGNGGPVSELQLSLMCAPATVSELSVMLRYCGPASVFGEQTYLPVQLQLNSSSPAVAAAMRLQAAASDRDRHGGGDTQAARDVAEVTTDPLPAHATVRASLAGLACPGVLYVELWHGPQLCACLPVLLLPESAASWAHEVCSLWQQQAEEGEAAEAVMQGGGGDGRAGAAAISAAAHQVVEDLGGWLTYSSHKRHMMERAAATDFPSMGAAAAPGYQSLGQLRPLPQYYPTGGGGGGSTMSTATFSPPQFLDEWFSGWVVDMMQADNTLSSPSVFTAGSAMAAPANPLQPRPQPTATSMVPAGGGSSYMVHGSGAAAGGAAAAAAAAGAAAGAASCNQELFHDMMLQEGYNWLADCVEAGCCGLAEALMESLLAAGCSLEEVLRTCRSADGLPLIHAAALSGSPAMINLVWGWGQATGTEMLGCAAAPSVCELARVEAGAEVVATNGPVATWIGGTGPMVAAASNAAAPVVAAGVESQGGSLTIARVTGSVVPRQVGPIEPGGCPAPMAAADSTTTTAAPVAATGTTSPEAVCSASREPAAKRTGADNLKAATWATSSVPRGLCTYVTALCTLPASAVHHYVHTAARGRVTSYVTKAWSATAAATITAAAALACLHSCGRSSITAAAAIAARLVQQSVVAGTSGTHDPGQQAHGAIGASSPASPLPEHDCSGGDGGGSFGWWWWWQFRAAVRQVCLTTLYRADTAIMRLHAAVLRANPLHEDGGAEERRFLSHFQQRHGWVFSAWCWSMIPLYALIAWRCLVEAQWAQLALTPLWMWMYVMCAAADVAGATAAYRRRMEALAAAMHLSHSLSKALYCAGLPSYPVPPGRLYWLDVLACATLSALCEPVRICVACPLRLVNFTVSTLLYRFTGTAPTYLEAALLSASCHCFGLLVQHAVESHYRRSFAALQQEQRGAAADGAESAAGAVAVPSAKSTYRRSVGGGTTAADAAEQQRAGFGLSACPPPELPSCAPSTPVVALARRSSEDWHVDGASAVGAAVTAAAGVVAAEAATAITTAAAPPPLPALTRYTSDSRGGVTWLLERDGGRLRAGGRPAGYNGRGGGGGGGLGLRLRELDAPVADARERFLLPDDDGGGGWELPGGADSGAGDGGDDHTWSSGWPYDGDSPAAVATCQLQTSSPPPPLRSQGQGPLEQWQQWQQRQQENEEQQRQQRQREEEEEQQLLLAGSEGMSPLEDSGDPGRGTRQPVPRGGGDAQGMAAGGEGGRQRLTSPPPLQQLPPQPYASSSTSLASAGTDAAAASTLPSTLPTTTAEAGTRANPVPRAVPVAATAAAVAAAGPGTGSNSSGGSSGRWHGLGFGSSDGWHRGRHGGRGGGAGGSGRSGGGSGGARCNHHDESSGGSDSGSARVGSDCSGASGACGVGTGGGGGGGRGSGSSLRQLVSRATNWVSGMLRRRSLRGVGSGGRKVARSS